MIEEIKAIARRHLAADGANLSLRAVARDLGVVSSALYRYFASRDELLTALIVDAYNALGDAVEAADAAVTDRADLRGRWLAVCHAVRRWALANPAEYALIFGSPVPGYAAPQTTTDAAVRTPLALVRIITDGVESGALRGPSGGPDLPVSVREDIARVRDQVFPGLPEHVLALGTIAWIHVFGAVSFELFGQLNNVIEAREAYFEYQMLIVAELIGL
jgi:AcrR family transcriptional regulator